MSDEKKIPYVGQEITLLLDNEMIKGEVLEVNEDHIIFRCDCHEIKHRIPLDDLEHDPEQIKNHFEGPTMPRQILEALRDKIQKGFFEAMEDGESALGGEAFIIQDGIKTPINFMKISLDNEPPEARIFGKLNADIEEKKKALDEDRKQRLERLKGFSIEGTIDPGSLESFRALFADNQLNEYNPLPPKVREKLKREFLEDQLWARRTSPIPKSGKSKEIQWLIFSAMEAAQNAR